MDFSFSIWLAFRYFFFVLAGYVVVGYWGLTYLIGRLKPEWAVPPLVAADEPGYRIVQVVMGLFFWRMLNRAGCAWRVYGPLQALLSIPRLFYGNFLNFAATCKAIQRYVGARMAGKVPEWGKTAHAYPSEDQLRSFRRKLGDLLLDRRLITAAELDRALEAQRREGGKLGEILVRMGVLDSDALTLVLEQQRKGS